MAAAARGGRLAWDALALFGALTGLGKVTNTETPELRRRQSGSLAPPQASPPTTEPDRRQHERAAGEGGGLRRGRALSRACHPPGGGATWAPSGAVRRDASNGRRNEMLSAHASFLNAPRRPPSKAYPRNRVGTVSPSTVT